MITKNPFSLYPFNSIFFILFFISYMPLCYAEDEEISETDGVYTLSKGNLSLSVSASEGGRIISFRRAEKEMLLQKNIHSKYYGSTLWLSPQRMFWPPSDILDSYPYRTEIDGETLRMVSEKDTVTGFRIMKEFTISKDTSIMINYIIENISDTTQSVAPWDVTRVNGGITFFPLKDIELNGLNPDLDHVLIKDDILCYTYSKDSIERGQKLFAITKNGSLAHYYNNLLFIKKFPEVNKKDLPELQGEVEIFLAPNSLYVELENHGKYTKLKKGELLEYRQQWYLMEVRSFNPDIRVLYNKF